MRFRAAILLVSAASITTPASHASAQQPAPLTAPVLATTLRPPNPRDGLLGVVSPDGRHYVYNQVDHGHTRLWLLDLATGRSRLLAPRGGSRWDFAWSPDGRRIAYVGEQDAREPDQPIGIWVLDVTAPRERLIFADSEISNLSRPTWLPDGRIVFVSDPGYMNLESSTYLALPRALRIVDPVTRRTRMLDSGSFGFDAPAPSPDGKQLAYIAPCADTRRLGIHVTPLRAPLAPSPRCLGTVSLRARGTLFWSPDSRVVYLAVPGARDSLGITVVDVATGHVTRVARPGIGRDAQLSVAADGRLLVAANTTTFRVGTLPAAGGPATLFQRDTSLEAGFPLWSNDGSVIVALADTTKSWRGIPRLHSAPARAGDPRRGVLQLIDFRRDEQPSRAIAPDGRCAVAGHFANDSTIGLEPAHAAGSWFSREAFTYADALKWGQGWPYAEGTMWSDDNRFVLRVVRDGLYRASRDRTSVESPSTPCKVSGGVHRLPLVGFAGEPILGGVSPDGRTLAFSRLARDGRDAGVFLVGTDGGQVRRVRTLPHDESMGGPEWSRDGQALYFADADSGNRYHILRLTLATGVVDTISRGATSVMHPRLSPDGTTIAVTIADATTKLWWIAPSGRASVPR